MDLPQRLIENGHVDQADIARAGDIAGRTGARLASTLVRLGLVGEAELVEAFAADTALPVVTRAELAERAMLGSFNPRFLRRKAALPLENDAGGVGVAMADPQDKDTLAALAFATGAPVAPVIATFSDVDEMLVVLGQDEVAADDGFGQTSSGMDADIERLLEEESEAPVIRLVQRLLTAAVNRAASDVHIEPMARYLAVRYRIDGQLTEVERLSDALAAPVASRVKVMAGLDIAESRLPQDGRLRLTVRGRDVDVRVSTSPTAWGESIVMRLLGRTTVPLDLERLGLPAIVLQKLERGLDRPHGLILVTGPTGSGKSTTLYAAINRLRRPEVKILTVEDPVEVLLEGINQVQVRPEIDLSYAATLRAFLRQDPDILMIGEIRDGETAEIAMRAALTGHLVLSTLHTNSALGAFTRIADIGVEPYLAASTVIATIAQRLVRGLCLECRRSVAPDRDALALFEANGVDAPTALWEPTGCGACGQTGFAGRLPLMELVEVDDRLRDHIRAGTAERHKEVIPPQERLLGHGLALVAAGRTSLQEVIRATSAA